MNEEKMKQTNTDIVNIQTVDKTITVCIHVTDFRNGRGTQKYQDRKLYQQLSIMHK